MVANKCAMYPKLVPKKNNEVNVITAYMRVNPSYRILI